MSLRAVSTKTRRASIMTVAKATPRRSPKDLKVALRERTREVEVLHRISESIGGTLELESVLNHIVDVVVEVTKADACLLYLVSIHRDAIVLRASKNPHPKLIGRISLGLGEGIAEWVAQENVPVVIPRHVSNDPRFRFSHNLPQDRYHAFVSLPIVTNKTVVGVINVPHKRPKRYQDATLALLSTDC